MLSRMPFSPFSLQSERVDWLQRAKWIFYNRRLLLRRWQPWWKCDEMGRHVHCLSISGWTTCSFLRYETSPDTFLELRSEKGSWGMTKEEILCFQGQTIFSGSDSQGQACADPREIHRRSTLVGVALGCAIGVTYNQIPRLKKFHSNTIAKHKGRFSTSAFLGTCVAVAAQWWGEATGSAETLLLQHAQVFFTCRQMLSDLSFGSMPWWPKFNALCLAVKRWELMPDLNIFDQLAISRTSNTLTNCWTVSFSCKSRTRTQRLASEYSNMVINETLPECEFCQYSMDVRSGCDQVPCPTQRRKFDRGRALYGDAVTGI